MKTIALLCVLAFGLGQCAIPACGQQKSDTKPKSDAKTKNGSTKVENARQNNHTVRQVTPDPKKSPGKHADNLSKNVNHEVNRESKDVNHSANKGSKAVNHSLNQFSKDVNHAFQKPKK
jgi:hypothetical protein